LKILRAGKRPRGKLKTLGVRLRRGGGGKGVGGVGGRKGQDVIAGVWGKERKVCLQIGRKGSGGRKREERSGGGKGERGGESN